jgi:hypothetical protein
MLLFFHTYISLLVEKNLGKSTSEFHSMKNQGEKL